MPIEVLAAAKIETTKELTQHILSEPDRIRHWHQHDFRVQQALFFQFEQTPLEQYGRQHRRRFVGMQRRLDIDLLPAIRRAKMKRHQFAVRADSR
jgi:hypothetical protein